MACVAGFYGAGTRTQQRWYCKTLPGGWQSQGGGYCARTVFARSSPALAPRRRHGSRRTSLPGRGACFYSHHMLGGGSDPPQRLHHMLGGGSRPPQHLHHMLGGGSRPPQRHVVSEGGGLLHMIWWSSLGRIHNGKNHNEVYDVCEVRRKVSVVRRFVLEYRWRVSSV